MENLTFVLFFMRSYDVIIIWVLQKLFSPIKSESLISKTALIAEKLRYLGWEIFSEPPCI